MGFGDRLKMVRKELELTQQEMADRMRIKRSCLANYETDRNFPIDAVIGLICQEFGTNEEWLRTGDGGKKNMFVKHNTTGRYLANLEKLRNADSEVVRRMVNAVAESSPAELERIDSFMRRFVGV